MGHQQIQIVVDKSPSDLEPVEEMTCLNGARAIENRPPIGPIDVQTSVFEGYGINLNNPVVVNGIVGLAAYLKSLRFKQSAGGPVKATLEWSTMRDDYPVDCLRVSDGVKEQHLFFCLYGRRCDTIYPLGFYREPFEGDFNFELSDFIAVAPSVQFVRNAENPVNIGVCIFGVDPSLSYSGSGHTQVVEGSKGRSIILVRTPTSDLPALAAHVTRYDKVFKKESRLKARPTPSTKREVSLDNSEERCWFSGQPAAAGCELTITMYRLISSYYAH
jgi:hypothetical protein